MLRKSKQIWNFSARAAVLGRALGWPKGKITSLPGFLSGWSNVRDTAIPPKKTFRAWFASEEGKKTLAAARKEGIPDNSFHHADNNTGDASEVKVSEPGSRKTSSKPLEDVLNHATSPSHAHENSGTKNSSREEK